MVNFFKKSTDITVPPKPINMEKRVEQYTDLEGLSTKKLTIGLWFVEHRQQLRWVLIGFLIAIAAISWVYTIYGFAYYLARGMNEDEILTRQMLTEGNIGHSYVAQIAAKDLTYSPVQIFRSGNNKYDFLVQANNINQKWWAEFNYYFLVDGVKSEKNPGFIFPLENKYFIALAQNFLTVQANVQFVVEDFSWHRINQHEINNWQDFYKNHLAIESKEIKYIPANQSELSEKIGLNQLNFTTTNKSAYNYWQVNYVILLYSGNNIVNVNRYTLTDFMSGQSRQINISWPGNFGLIDRVELIPEINIMDNDVYIKYEGGAGEEK